MYSDNDDPKGPGFPIRISPDQSSFAAPRSFSQRITSFIASRCQGIHQTPLRRLTDPTSNDQRPMPCFFAAESRPDLRQADQTRLGGTSRTPLGLGMTTSVTQQQTVSRSGTAQHLQSALIQLHRASETCVPSTSTPELDQHALHHVQKITPAPQSTRTSARRPKISVLPYEIEPHRRYRSAARAAAPQSGPAGELGGPGKT
jgi:hypothetical protein